MKGTGSQSIMRRNETVPWNNVGRQSNSNVERTLGHVEPTMGGVMTLPPPQVECPRSTIHG